MKVNIKKISELSGFSIATVSNALNKKKGVNAETARKIIAIAEEYGYISESKPESITLVAYRASGQVLATSPFFAALLESVENESRRHGFETKLVNLYREAEGYREELERLLDDTASALLVVGTELGEEEAKHFLEAKAPLVVLDSSFPGVPLNAVLMDNEASVHQAAEYLIGLGHKEIGYLCSATATQNFAERYRGYRRAMAEHGLTIDERFVKALPPTLSDAHEECAAWLAEKPALPTAFLADNDLLALGAMQAMQAAGIAVPDDVSLIGFDDISFSQVMQPGLTTVRVPKKELGQAAVRRLIDLINEPEQAASCIHVYNEFIVRGSTKERTGE